MQQSMGLNVTFSSDGVGPLLTVSGELDIGSAPVLREALLKLLGGEETPDLVVDTRGLTFVDSSGLAVLLMGARRWTAESRTLVLRAPSPTLARLLDLTGVRRAFVVEEDGDQV